MPLSSHAYNLRQAFDQPGCAVCRLTLDSVHHYLGSLVYEYVNKVPTHEAVRAARGFCATHAWHIQEQFPASGVGVAVLYEGLVRNMLNDMGDVPPNGNRRQVANAASALQAHGECPACTHRATVETHLLRNLLDHLDQEDFAAGFSASSGLCLPHLRAALEISGQHANKTRLLAAQQAIWRELQADLAEYMRKNDYRFQPEGMGKEGDSPHRAIESISGAKEIR